MGKTLIVGILALIVVGALMASGQAGLDPAVAGIIPTNTPTVGPTDTPTVGATATSTPLAATATATPAGTAVAAGTATATPVQPVAAPQTGAEPGSGSGSDILLVALLLGAAAFISAGGVVAGFALGRRIS